VDLIERQRTVAVTHDAVIPFVHGSLPRLALGIGAPTTTRVLFKPLSLRGGMAAEEIAKEIDALLRADPLTAPRLEAAAAAWDEIPF
jgi:hypothetical protein